jgi:hypothetical protein
MQAGQIKNPGPKKISAWGFAITTKTGFLAAGLLTRGSFYRPPLPMPFRVVITAQWSWRRFEIPVQDIQTGAPGGFRPRSQRRVRSGIAPDSLLSHKMGTTEELL